MEDNRNQTQTEEPAVKMSPDNSNPDTEIKPADVTGNSLLQRLKKNREGAQNIGRFSTDEGVLSAYRQTESSPSVQAELPSAVQTSRAVPETSAADSADEEPDVAPLFHVSEIPEIGWPEEQDAQKFTVSVQSRGEKLQGHFEGSAAQPAAAQPAAEVISPFEAVERPEDPVTSAPQDVFSTVTDNIYQMQTPSEQLPSAPQVIAPAENAEAPQTQVSPQPAQSGVPDQTDINLMYLFGMDQELRQTLGDEGAQRVAKTMEEKGETIDEKLVNGTEESIPVEEPSQPVIEEFTDPAQIKDISQRYKNEYSMLVWRLLAGGLLAIVTFFYENFGIFGIPLPPFFAADSYPVCHVLIGLQLLLIGGVLVYKQIGRGLSALLKTKPVPESTLSLLFVISVVYQIVLCFLPLYEGVRIYNFPMMIAVIFALLYELDNLKSEMFAFNVIAGKKPKYTIDHVDAEESLHEKEAFGELLPANPSLFRIGRVNFIDNFYRRSRHTEVDKKPLGYLIPAAAVVSLLFLIGGLITGKTLYSGLLNGYIALMLITPLTVFTTYSYPLYTASKAAYGEGSAIIGECSLEEYRRASAITFDDVDVFPPKQCKLKTVKTFGSARIDQVILDTKCIFNMLGGPLAACFSSATDLDAGTEDYVDILSIEEDGIEVMLGDRHLMIGKGSYLHRKGFEPVNAREDENLENNGSYTVMYMVAGSEVVAKYYLQYGIDRDFDFTLSQLYKSNMCVGIRTIDPNISDFMISTRVRISKYAVKVLQYHEPLPRREKAEHTESGIVSKKSPKALLMTLALCEKVSHIIRTSLVVKLLSMVIALVVMICVLLFGLAGDFWSVYVALYQLFWLIPMVVIVKLFI